MVGAEMLRMRFSNELIFCLGLGFINKAGMKMAATPPPLPLSLGMCVLMWLGGVDSLRLTYLSWYSQVSVRQNKSILLSYISSFINTALDDRDRIFKSPLLSLFIL